MSSDKEEEFPDAELVPPSEAEKISSGPATTREPVEVCVRCLKSLWHKDVWAMNDEDDGLCITPPGRKKCQRCSRLGKECVPIPESQRPAARELLDYWQDYAPGGVPRPPQVMKAYPTDDMTSDIFKKQCFEFLADDYPITPVEEEPKTSGKGAKEGSSGNAKASGGKAKQGGKTKPGGKAKQGEKSSASKTISGGSEKRESEERESESSESESEDSETESELDTKPAKRRRGIKSGKKKQNARVSLSTNDDIGVKLEMMKILGKVAGSSSSSNEAQAISLEILKVLQKISRNLASINRKMK